MPYATNSEDGVRTYYEDDGGKGPVVLFYSGFTDKLGDSRVTALARALRRRCRLVYADHRGHGKSDKPHDPAAYDIKLRVKDVVAVVDALGLEKIHFSGSSWGARLGFAVGEYAPDRVASLILGGNQPYEWDLDSPLLTPVIEGIKALRTGGMMGFVNKAEELLGERWPEPSRSHVQDNDPLAIEAAWKSVYDEGVISDDLTKWQVPCLIYAGSRDPMHDDAKRAASEIPGAVFVTLEGQTHLSAVGAEDAVVSHALRQLGLES